MEGFRNLPPIKSLLFFSPIFFSNAARKGKCRKEKRDRKVGGNLLKLPSNARLRPALQLISKNLRLNLALMVQ
jgi:hypothetical protein